MNVNLSKFLAVGEVFIVVFLIVPVVTLGIYKLFPGFEAWQTQSLGFPFPIFVDVVMVGVSLIAIRLHRRNLGDFGICFTPFKYHLDIAAACFIPVMLAGFPIGLGVDYKSWGGAFILAFIQICLLFILALILRKKPSMTSTTVAIAGILFLSPISSVSASTVGKAITLFLTYALFVGFGEEIIYRGYTQSRLNEVFGKPFRFFGVDFGWGIIIMAFIFGLSHVGILSWMLGYSVELALPWGFWTFFGGLVYGFVREKSGSIFAPALLHGLPQAIATVMMLFIN